MLMKLQFRPGVDRDRTNYSTDATWFEMDKVRFFAGFPQKIGGWEKYSTTTFYGVCRNLNTWVTTYSDNITGLGTHNKLYLEVGGGFFDITPLRATNPTMTTPNTDNCVATSNGSRVVTINLGTSHNADDGSFVTIAGVTGTVGGVPNSEINANHQITVIDSDSFSITVTTAATSTVASGGGTAITISFEIAPGYAIDTEGYGWDTGSWGRGAWGSGSTSPIILPQRDWWTANFDNDFVANIRNGAPYYWERGTTDDPTTALGTRAITLQAYATAGGYTADAVPAAVGQLMVSQNDKHLIAFGAVPFGSTSLADFDPMLIRWADQDNPGQWTPAVTNSAGDMHVSNGSMIVRAIPTRQEILVLTDASLYGMQFLGTTDVFGLQEYSNNISIMSPRAVVVANEIAYWMGQGKFYAYNGRVETLPCSLRDHVFNDINLGQAAQVVSGTNERFGEVWWFYPSAGSSQNDRYVVFNYEQNVWYYGTMERSAWLDTPLRDYPLACDSSILTNGYLYQHEAGLDADGEAMDSYIQSSDVELATDADGAGGRFMLTQRLIPDLDFTGSSAQTPSLTFSLYPRRFPGTAYTTDDSDTVIQTEVGAYTGQVFLRARARQIAIRVQSTALGVAWKLGTPRLEVRTSGKR
jgi:hypothetical protein